MNFRNFEAEEKLFVRRALVAFARCYLLHHSWHQPVSLTGGSAQLLPDAFQRERHQNDPHRADARADSIATASAGAQRHRYDILVTPYKIDNMQATLKALTPIVDLTPDDIETFEHELKQSSRYKPVELKAELTDEEVARSVNQFRFTGVTIDTYQDREYPYGADLAHVVGYVSKINDNDYKRLMPRASAKLRRRP